MSGPDRDLLVAFLATQAGYVPQSTAAEVLQKCRDEGNRPVGESLVERGLLDEAAREQIERAADRQIADGEAIPSASHNPEPAEMQSLRQFAAECQRAAGLDAAQSPTVISKTSTARGAPGATGSEPARFRALAPHAKGGIGTVFLARDEQLKRQVALKEIQPRFADDANSRERFLREAEITGMLEHPGIVPVYGLGRYEDGRPYYAMRMIHGKSLQEAIDALYRDRPNDEHAFQLELRRLVNRFVTVCNTMEYAHSRMVIHRDLKPANIMLGPYGETLVVDWGLAKQLGSPQGDRTEAPGRRTVSGSAIEATQAGTIVGTPAYMSPEQALGWHDSLTPASDIYSLGATLYALLTGRPSITGRDLSQSLISIQKQDFPKPRELEPSIPRPLEAICLKAMARSATGRYRTAAKMAADIEAFLADEPVTAWSEPILVRVGRWVRRHRTFVTSVAATGAVILAALGAYIPIQNANNRKLATANVRLGEQQKATGVQRDQANTNFRMALDAVERYFTQVSEDPRLKEQKFQGLRQDLLKTSGQFYERFVKQNAQSDESRWQQAWAGLSLAMIMEETGPAGEAVATYERAAKLFRDGLKPDSSRDAFLEGLMLCEINLSSLYDEQGQRPKATAAINEAMRIAGEMRGRSNPKYLHDLARCFAVRAHRSFDAGKLDQAESDYKEEIGIRESLVQSHPADPIYQNDLALAYQNLSILDQRQGQIKNAGEMLEKSLAIDRRLVRDHPADGDLANSLAQTLCSLGGLAEKTGHADAAQKAYAEAVDLRAALVRKFPDVLAYRAALAQTYSSLGPLQFKLGDPAAAENSFAQAYIHASRLAADYPDNLIYQRRLAEILRNFATVCMSTNRWQLAERSLLQAEKIRGSVKAALPKDPQVEAELADVWREEADLEAGTRRAQAARAHLQSAIEVFGRLAKEHRNERSYAVRLAVCHQQLGDLLKAMRQPTDAETAYRLALDERRALIRAHPDVPEYANELASTCVNLGNLLLDQSRNAEALTLFQESTQALHGHTSRTDPESRAILKGAFAGRALAQEALGNRAATIADIKQAISYARSGSALPLRLKLAGLLADTGDYRAAAAEADGLTKAAVGVGPVLFELANIYAKAAAAAQRDTSASPTDRARWEARYVEQALEHLKSAQAGGFFADRANRNQLQTSPFVPLLTKNPAYQQVIHAAEKPLPEKGK